MKDSMMHSGEPRMKGFIIGGILFVASLVVASSVTAIVNLVFIALPVLTIVAVVGIFAVGVPLLFAGIQASRDAEAKAVTEDPSAHPSAVQMSLEGFWKHAHSERADFVDFQPMDHDVVIHLDSQSDDHSMTMREFVQMTAAPQEQNRELEKSLEGLTDYRRM